MVDSGVVAARAGPVIVCGAGLAGLSCARQLVAQGAEVVVFEAGSQIGGRVGTVEQDGFLLDVGFQVLLTDYPEAKARLDYSALGLRAFRPGSLVRLRDGTTSLTDPWREPLRGLRSLLSPLLSPADALRMARLRSRLVRSTGDLSGTAADVLDRSGISSDLRRGFLNPFFSGVTLDPSLSVPGDYFAFLFRMFARGDAALLAAGMGAIPAQLAKSLPAGAIQLRRRVREVGAGYVVLDDGHRLDGAAVVVATEGHVARELTGCPAPSGWNSTTTIYFAADEPPIRDAMLMLNGTGEGPIHHVCVPDVVQPSYAPVGKSLLSVSVLGAVPPDDDDGDRALVGQVRDQLRDWFGAGVARWSFLRTFRIRTAQPKLPPDQPAMSRSGVHVANERLIVCGDHLATPSIQGAMVAGRRAAEALLTEPALG